MGRPKTHGLTHTRLYTIWACMLQRCYNPKNTNYIYYGRKGIKCCDEWLSFYPFYDWAIKHGYNDNLTLDRLNNAKNYEPNNCVWSSRRTQSNNRTNNLKITYNNNTLTLSQWARILNISYITLYKRLTAYNMTIEQAFFSPLHKQKN